VEKLETWGMKKKIISYVHKIWTILPGVSVWGLKLCFPYCTFIRFELGVISLWYPYSDWV